MQPTYKAEEIKRMCIELPMDHLTFSLLVEVIEEDLELYNEDELVILFQASMIMFTRSILQLSLKNMSCGN